MAADVPDVACAVKELCRGRASPTRRDAEPLKLLRLIRHLLERPRFVMHLGWQPASSAVEVLTEKRLGRMPPHT